MCTIWLFYIAMERSTIFKFGKPSISMGHLYHGYVTNNQSQTMSTHWSPGSRSAKVHGKNPTSAGFQMIYSTSNGLLGHLWFRGPGALSKLFFRVPTWKIIPSRSWSSYKNHGWIPICSSLESLLDHHVSSFMLTSRENPDASWVFHGVLIIFHASIPKDPNPSVFPVSKGATSSATRPSCWAQLMAQLAIFCGSSSLRITEGSQKKHQIPWVLWWIMLLIYIYKYIYI